jgi:cellulose synthase (UDP-forming)
MTYVTRPDTRDRKAGNHNHALTVSTAPFIMSMDADFMPFPNFGRPGEK